MCDQSTTKNNFSLNIFLKQWHIYYAKNVIMQIILYVCSLMVIYYYYGRNRVIKTVPVINYNKNNICW